MSGINIIISIYSLIIKMALENKALEIHNIILKKLVEDPNRREIGSFFVLDVKNYNGKIEYWLQGNFCKEDLQLEEFQLDKVIQVDIGSFLFGNETDGFSKILMNFEGLKEEKIIDYEREEKINNGRNLGCSMLDGFSPRIKNVQTLEFLIERLVLGFDLKNELEKDLVRKLDSNTIIDINGLLVDVLSYLNIIGNGYWVNQPIEQYKSKIIIENYIPNKEKNLPSEITREDPISIEFLKSIPNKYFNKPISISVDHFQENMYSLHKFNGEVYIRAYKNPKRLDFKRTFREKL